MADDLIRRLAIEQRKRLVASLMSFCENASWWSKITPQERKDMRDKVLNSVGSYHDFMLDVVKVSGEDSMVSQEALAMITQLNARAARIEKMVERGND